jgi:hypothetical protein
MIILVTVVGASWSQIYKTLSKFEKFLPKFTTFFKNNKLLIPTVSAVTRLVVLRVAISVNSFPR